jgi:hypothetical protein
MIVKTDGYTHDQVGKVVQLRANIEGLRLGNGVLDRLAAEGEKASLRYVLFPHPYTFFFSAIDTNPLHGCDANCANPDTPSNS